MVLEGKEITQSQFGRKYRRKPDSREAETIRMSLHKQQSDLSAQNVSFVSILKIDRHCCGSLCRANFHLG